MLDVGGVEDATSLVDRASQVGIIFKVTCAGCGTTNSCGLLCSDPDLSVHRSRRMTSLDTFEMANRHLGRI